MPPSRPAPGSLVLYKSKRALVAGLSDKLDIVLEDGKSKRVREKDVQLLHPGPIGSLAEVREAEGETDEAWELLQGSCTDLRELAELVYGDFTPSAAWSLWCRVAEGLHFAGSPDAITVRTAREVEADLSARREKEAARRDWEAFLERLRRREATGEDGERLREVESLAFGQTDRSRILRALERPEQPESAHRALCELGHWPTRFNPHPFRQGVALADPDDEVPSLPDEARLDLTALETYAIDDPGNEDPDDAISVEGDRLWVHVADVGALVPPGSPLDLGARGRGSNLYLPERVVHMLPPRVTSALGLGLEARSPALSIGVAMDAEGEPRVETIAPSLIAARRSTYEEVDGLLDRPPFDRMAAAAERYRERRRRAGAVRIDLPEVSVRLDGDRVVVRPLVRSGSREMVADIMLMAGEAVARYALERGIPIPFASQPPADSDQRSPGLSGMYALRRMMKPSRVGGTKGPHAGLGLEAYTRVTSPLRRYVDLLAHQQLRAHLRGEALLSAGELADRVAACEPANAAIRRAERLSNLHWKLVYLADNPDWTGEGVVVDRDGQRATLVLPELALETRLRLPREPALDTPLRLRIREIDLYGLTAWFRTLKGA